MANSQYRKVYSVQCIRAVMNGSTYAAQNILNRTSRHVAKFTHLRPYQLHYDRFPTALSPPATSHQSGGVGDTATSSEISIAHPSIINFTKESTIN